MKKRLLVLFNGRGVLLICVALALCQARAIAAPKAEAIPFWNDSEEQSRLKVDHSILDAVLAKYVNAEHPSGINRFDYESVTDKDKTLLDEYLEYVERYDPRQMTKLRQKAYWLNVFNATMLKIILDADSRRTVKQLGNRLWRKNRLTIAYQDTSLNDIEHGILRPIFADPRIHFSMAAGALGSANILPQAFTAENVETLLEKNTADYLQHPRGVAYEDGRIVMSSIFKWYPEDFGEDFDSIKQFVMPYLSPDMVGNLKSAKRAKYRYEWELNKP